MCSRFGGLRGVGFVKEARLRRGDSGGLSARAKRRSNDIKEQLSGTIAEHSGKVKVGMGANLGVK
jgi:hypothetical protein